MKIWAGWTLNHRKPISAPMTSAQKTARFGCASFMPATGDEADQQVGDEAEDRGRRRRGRRAHRSGSPRCSCRRSRRRRTPTKSTGPTSIWPTSGMFMRGEVEVAPDVERGQDGDDVCQTSFQRPRMPIPLRTFTKSSIAPRMPTPTSVSIGVSVAASSMRRAIARKRTTTTTSMPPIVGVPALPVVRLRAVGCGSACRSRGAGGGRCRSAPGAPSRRRRAAARRRCR